MQTRELPPGKDEREQQGGDNTEASPFAEGRELARSPRGNRQRGEGQAGEYFCARPEHSEKSGPGAVALGLHVKSRRQEAGGCEVHSLENDVLESEACEQVNQQHRQRGMEEPVRRGRTEGESKQRDLQQDVESQHLQGEQGGISLRAGSRQRQKKPKHRLYLQKIRTSELAQLASALTSTSKQVRKFPIDSRVDVRRSILTKEV